MGRIRWRRGNNALLLMNEIIAAAFGLMGAIVGSIITLAGQWRYEKTNKNRELSYAAVVISYAAKKLASRTWDAINNFDEYQQVYNKEHRHFPCGTPMLDLNSFDINWKAVPISCLDKIFECSNRLEIKAKYLNTPMASNTDLITQVAPRRASRAHRLVRIYQSDHVAQCHPVPERPFPA
jgi:hypothetical protein